MDGGHTLQGDLVHGYLGGKGVGGWCLDLLQRQPEGGHGVFGDAVSVKAPVGVAPAPEGVLCRVIPPSAGGQEKQRQQDQNQFHHGSVLNVKGFQALLCQHLVAILDLDS